MKKIKPIIKWLGGKNNEFKYFKNYFPKDIENYNYIIEPFAGGISTSLNLYNSLNKNTTFLLNDLDDNLINFYNFIKEKNSFFLEEILNIEKQRQIFKQTAIKLEKEINGNIENNKIKNIRLTINNEEFKKDLLNNIKLNMKYYSSNKKHKKDKNLIELLYMKSLYETCRNIYNKKINIKNKYLFLASWYYVKEYAFSGSVRYNKKGEFNVPYGGKGYNKKDFSKKILLAYNDKLYREFFIKSHFYNEDYKDFLHKIIEKVKNNKTFVFLDPPYDTPFKNYLNNSKFEKEEQIKLKNILLEIKKSENIKIMLIINETQFIKEIYSNDFYIVEKYNKKYNVNLKNCNTRYQTKHLIITNYEF